eukprot:m.353557 g.353557  ORF g.353557 m.353557 type:complete len:137 (+) comp16792_c0_seq1:271-681(+)
MGPAVTNRRKLKGPEIKRQRRARKQKQAARKRHQEKLAGTAPTGRARTNPQANLQLSKKKQRGLRTQIKHELREKGLNVDDFEDLLPGKAKKQKKPLALQAAEAVEGGDAMELATAGAGIGITLGAPTTFATLTVE